ncbi:MULTISPECIES: sugar transferase [Roseovarius]|uniref:sugar transferase n=1 Tax=Roseovarius TaxID=74030 RepID=UPI00273F7188|nr:MULTISPECIES: sugar transferase [unclassified Roseovarius]
MSSRDQLHGETDLRAFHPGYVSSQFPTPRKHRSARIFGSLFDKSFAFLALLLFAPFILSISLVILLKEGRPIFFAHKRVGQNGEPFKCIKFRTMVVDADEQLKKLLDSDPDARAQWAANQKLDDDPRVSCIGEFFRITSLDELPQFWNVLRGEMAIVGPRPIVKDELEHYGRHANVYLSVRPGITGLWQVSGRSNTTYEERVALDVEYVRNRTFWGDVRIILKTVKVMLTVDGAK